MMTVNFGTCAHATAVTIFAPARAMPSFSYLRPTMKPVMFCRKTRGTFRWQSEVLRARRFAASFGDLREPCVQIVDQHAHRRGVDLELLRACAHLRDELGH